LLSQEAAIACRPTHPQEAQTEGQAVLPLPETSSQILVLTGSTSFMALLFFLLLKSRSNYIVEFINGNLEK
jgi:hypothetical protein